MTDLPHGVYLRNGEVRFSWAWMLELALACDRPFRILGQLCSSAGCCELAQFRCYWLGEATARCVRCANKLDEIARSFAMGLPVEPIHIAPDTRRLLMADYRAALARADVPPDDPTMARFAAMELD
jgi:hypothetical protein